MVTPLQMALATAAIANGGKVYRPRLVTWSDDPALEPLPEIGEVLNQLGWSRGNIDLIRDGMRDVIQADRGTGKRARIADVAMVGKTGTAQYGPVAKRKKHAWMIVYAPSERPRYALAIVIEDAISGGTSAAPLVKRIMGKVFEKERERMRSS